jgi:rubrerythrin
MLAFDFECPGCGYQYTGAGERSALMSGPTHCIVCLHCKELQDVIVWDKQENPSMTPTEAQCRDDPGHQVREWSHPGACPKCGVTMERDEGIMICAD